LHAPAGAEAVVQGVATQAFNWATSVSFAGLSAGIYTVSVATAEGYLPEQDPTLPGQVDNPDSYLYGNPKRVEVAEDTWRFAVFQFMPSVTVTGTVRNAWTGERIDADIAFTALSGIITGLVYQGYPAFAAYRSGWCSAAGSFPDDVWLPPVDWSLSLSRTGFSNAIQTNAISGADPGEKIDLGSLYLVPADDDGNGLPDEWQEIYFPGQSTGPTNDPDQDGVCNWYEYLCGTDPTNAASKLAVGELDDSAEWFTLRWPCTPGRTYEVLGIEYLVTGVWSVVGGPMEAGEGQYEMEWADTGSTGVVNRFYRVDLVTP
jgi:hypothetical protein